MLGINQPNVYYNKAVITFTLLKRIETCKEYTVLTAFIYCMDFPLHSPTRSLMCVRYHVEFTYLSLRIYQLLYYACCKVIKALILCKPVISN